MKIFQVFESYPLFYQPYISPVLDELKKQKGFEISILAFRGEKGKTNEASILPGINQRTVITKIARHLKREYSSLNYFEIKLLKEKADIVHLQHSFLHPKVHKLLKIPKENRPRIIITLRGGDTYVKPWVSDKWRNFYKNYGNKVDAFVVMSEDQKNYLTRWGVPLAKIHVIPISFGSKHSVEPKLPNSHTLKLASIFRMCWEKNITDSFRFVKWIKDKNIPVTYDMYGDGPDFGQLYYLRDKFNLNDTVTIHGKVPNEELKQKLKTFDFILQLSLSESLGMSVIEAQSIGVPAIVSKNGGLPEIIRDKINGINVELNNFEKGVSEVVSIWKNESLYVEMSKKAIDISHQNYSVETEVEGLTNLYLNIG